MVSKTLQDFDIGQIANSGQCFRMSEISPAIWTFKALGRVLHITKMSTNKYIFDCSEEEYENLWYNYFDLDTNYSIYKEVIRHSQDPYLIKAIDFGYGIRILHQDLWETMVSFIISQRNNIKRIKGIIERLCYPFNGVFPSPSLLEDYSEDDFKVLGLGYRAKYIVNLVKAVLNGELDLDYLKNVANARRVKMLAEIQWYRRKSSKLYCPIFFA